MYYRRNIDEHLLEWSKRETHKPLLLRGARQVGKSTAVRHLGEQFESFVEINFERNPEYKVLFASNLDVKRVCAQMSAMCGKAIVPGKTLLFLDEIQECQEAIMALRFFREDMPMLHVIAAGSLLEFALDELPTFGVGRIHSLYMHPMTFDEFLIADGQQLLLDARNQSSMQEPLPEPLYNKIVELFRTYMIVGGMPEAVASWVENQDYIRCQEIQDDILTGYEDDFPKYRKKVNTDLLRATFRSIANQITKKFVYAEVGGGYKATDIKKALNILYKAGLVIPVTHTHANGLPLGGEADECFRKMLFIDSGLLLRMLNMTLGNVNEITTQILTASVSDLVNKGSMAEMVAGLEIVRNQTPNLKYELYYWVRKARGAQAEIDYVVAKDSKVVPIEVKADCQGGMKSLWNFM
ncbi:MAG: ATP-binding protein, partial [Bacteroidaceae bacterium]|nr:ATP-binding protein [Bacteroidaceae bacterium]